MDARSLDEGLAMADADRTRVEIAADARFSQSTGPAPRFRSTHILDLGFQSHGSSPRNFENCDCFGRRATLAGAPILPGAARAAREPPRRSLPRFPLRRRNGLGAGEAL